MPTHNQSRVSAVLALHAIDVIASMLRRILAKLGATVLMLTVRALSMIGVLDHAGDLLIGLLVKRGRPGPLTDAQQRTAKTVKDSIYARLVVEGYLSVAPGARAYPEWHALNEQLLREGTAETAGAGVNIPDFLTGFERLLGENFSGGNSVRPLIDGPASFEQRYALIESARHSIYLATWKIYGDETGKKTVDSLLARRRLIPAIDIRVIVDGNVAAANPLSLEQLKRLVDGGIPVAFYHHHDRPFDGFHYKQLIIDGATDDLVSIVGGMNIGDAYSHGFGTPKARDPSRCRWRDTDVRIEGPNVRDDCSAFIRLWNGQASRVNCVDVFHQVHVPMVLSGNWPPVRSRGQARVMTAIDEPGPESRQKVMLGMVRAISAAQRSVDVENAYFMDVPAIRNALTSSMTRGVCVRVLTNSTETVDETAVCVPILKGLQKLLEAAEGVAADPDQCQVYVRNRIHPGIRDADTLHSKFMVVDRTFSVVASLNIHARSLRLEVEGAHFILDQGLGEALSMQFDRDLGTARRYRTADEIQFPSDLISRIMRRVDLHPVLL